MECEKILESDLLIESWLDCKDDWQQNDLIPPDLDWESLQHQNPAQDLNWESELFAELPDLWSLTPITDDEVFKVPKPPLAPPPAPKPGLWRPRAYRQKPPKVQKKKAPIPIAPRQPKETQRDQVVQRLGSMLVDRQKRKRAAEEENFLKSGVGMDELMMRAWCSIPPLRCYTKLDKEHYTYTTQTEHEACRVALFVLELGDMYTGRLNPANINMVVDELKKLESNTHSYKLMRADYWPKRERCNKWQLVMHLVSSEDKEWTIKDCLLEHLRMDIVKPENRYGFISHDTCFPQRIMIPH
ncbi:protein ORF17 [Cyprinid herpesvirus 1]|uniref:Protein ORF17 n=1 Tax=Cyprinid herpesvirus 1 TaxID=317858 RepID=K7PBV1_9VIRU|nr:protein ORF17 [Cyprinid herpesvirus 1]AFJ20323.1 protein ORF17 [Cyprinid herpesvirus 1]